MERVISKDAQSPTLTDLKLLEKEILQKRAKLFLPDVVVGVCGSRRRDFGWRTGGGSTVHSITIGAEISAASSCCIRGGSLGNTAIRQSCSRTWSRFGCRCGWWKWRASCWGRSCLVFSTACRSPRSMRWSLRSCMSTNWGSSRRSSSVVRLEWDEPVFDWCRFGTRAENPGVASSARMPLGERAGALSGFNFRVGRTDSPSVVGLATDRPTRILRIDSTPVLAGPDWRQWRIA